MFDFDGTLTRNDTFLDFHVTRFGLLRVGAAMAAGVCRGALARDAVKEAFTGNLWTGARHEDYLSAARSYAESRVEKNLLPKAMSAFTRHLESGDDVYIVTASFRDWVGFWAQRYGVPVIGTELGVSGGVLTGRFSTPNCRGAEKVRRIRAEVDLSAYSKIYAYGNSEGDRQMLDIADEAVYRWNRDVKI